MSTQAGTMLHPAAALRNAPSMTPNIAAGRRGLLRSLASGSALGPSTTLGSSLRPEFVQLDQRQLRRKCLFV